MNTYLTDILQNGALMITTITGIVLLLVEANRRGRPAVSFVLAIIGLLAAAVAALIQMPANGTGFGGMVHTGGFANFFAALFAVAGAMTIAVSRSYLPRIGWFRGEYAILTVFAVIGMMLIAAANDLIILFLGIELMSVCLYVLAGLARVRDRSNEAALKYFLLGAFATGFLLYGIALVYGAVGSTNFDAIRGAFPAVGTQALFLGGAGLIVVGLSFKASAVPFHMWAPDVYEGSPTTVTAFMSTAAKAAAFSGFLVLFVRTFHFVGAGLNTVLATIAAASMILGNIVAIAQTNIKRMLAYSSIAHAGYMLAGVAAANPMGQMGVAFYLVAYAFMNIGAFTIVSLVEDGNEQHLTLDDYAGLSKQRPLVAALMAVFMFALAGVPPFAGFFGKYYVFLAAVEGNLTWLAIVGVLTSLISAYYYLRIVVLMYFRDGSADVAAKPSVLAMVTVVLAALLVLQLGITPSLVVQAAQRFF